jgi:hypothetical protein
LRAATFSWKDSWLSTILRAESTVPIVYTASVCGAIALRSERIGASFRNPQTVA